jgi:uncharacterized protein (DUF1697 family)
MTVPPPILYVAFLRGVDSPRLAPRDELRRCFIEGGYDRVAPVLSTGNVVFGPGRNPDPPRERAISDMLARHFGYPLPVIVWTGADVAGTVNYPPFPDFDPARMKRFVAMLSEEAPPVDALRPRPVPDDGYVITARSGRDLFFLVDRKRRRMPHLMARLERAFGDEVTTRDWNTMEKVAAALAKTETDLGRDSRPDSDGVN